MTDIVGGVVEDWVVVGWFTPDYRPLAEKFAANLNEHGIPHHLFAREKLEKGWNTQQKPSVVLSAMDAYPHTTLVLMDVDCKICGDVRPVVYFEGDVGISIKTRQLRRGWWASRRPIAIMMSSRVAVFKPTSVARLFAETWKTECGHTDYSGDETALTYAFLRSPKTEFHYNDIKFRGLEVGCAGTPDDAIIVHVSVHERHRQRDMGFIRRSLRAFERKWLRTGHTKRESIGRLKDEPPPAKE